MRSYRFYLDSSREINNIDSQSGLIISSDEHIIHQILNVLRLKEDSQESIVFFDGSGLVFETKILEFFSDKKSKKSIDKIHFKIQKKYQSDKEIKSKVRFFIPVIKIDMVELMVQKLTELGAQEIIPVNFARSQKQNLAKINNESEQKRLIKISIEAVEQCEGAVLPKISQLINFTDIQKVICAKDISFFASERLANSEISEKNLVSSIKLATEDKNSFVNLLVGPEGGLSDEENQTLEGLGFAPLSLGKRLLKAETAAISLFSRFDFL